MKRISTLLVVFSIFLSGNLFAQPSNDDCANPILITDLDGTCNTYDNTGATNDIADGSCFIGSPTNNIWFDFVADGPNIVIDWDNFGGTFGINASLLEVTSCDFAGLNQLACGSGLATEVISFSGLTVGNTYYVLVSLVGQGGAVYEGNFGLCITNLASTAPVNDDSCFPTSILANGTCYDGTTVDATNDFSSNFSTCVDAPDQGVFFEFTASPGNLIASIDIDNVAGSGEFTVAIGQLPTGCTGNFVFNPDVFCGTSGTDIIADAFIEPGQTYVIWVASTEANEGEFEICVTESGPPPGCSENNTCNTAETITGVVTGQPSTCVDGCNILASPGGIDGIGCNLTTEETVWYEFTTDADAGYTTLNLTSDDIDDPILQLFEWNCTGSPIQVGPCVTGAAGEASATNIIVSPNTTYLIAISNEFGDGGEFDLCVFTYPNTNACVDQGTTLEVVPGSPSLGSPDSGPFLPGEAVTFRFELPNYHADPVGSGNNCQWLQGIVPIFGNGWDNASFDGNTVNITPYSGGAVWSWYGQGVITYTSVSSVYDIADFDGDGDIDICHISDGQCIGGVATGDPMPAGWYASANGGFPVNTYGDGNCCSCDMGPWEVVFTITTKEYTDCSGPPEETDLSINMYTFADGETGLWGAQNSNVQSVCGEDIPSQIPATLNCCLGPEATPQNATICPGDALSVILETDPVNDDATFNWEVLNQGNTSGAMDGSGQVIGDVITNNTTTTQTVTYLVTASDESGCPGLESEVTVIVLPAIEVDAGEDIEGCTGVEAILGGSPTATGGGGLFDYDWGDPSIDDVANPEASPTLSSTYVLTVTDLNGCSATDDIQLFINPSFDVIIEGDTVLCFNDPTTVFSGSPQGGTPNYTFDWNGAGINGFPGQVLNYNGQIVGSGDYFLNLVVTDNFGCTGEAEVSVNILDEPTVFIVSTPESGEFCPGGSILLQAAAVNGEPGVVYSYDWTTPSGGFLNGQTINVTEEGEYLLEVTDDLIECAITATYTVSEVPPPSPEIDAPTGLCNGDEVSITTLEEYEEYEWSTNEDTEDIMVGPGTYTVTVTSSAGCTGEETITIPPFTDPDVSISGSSTFCVGSSSILSVSDDFTEFVWTDENDDVIGDTDTLLVTDEGTYNIIVTDENGCNANSALFVTIQDFLVPNISGDTAICPSDCTSLDAGAGYMSYLWSSDEITQMITVCDPGSYSVTVFDQGGCSGEQIKNITINDLPVPQILGEDNETSFCPNSSLTLDAGSGYSTYSWSTDEIGQNITVDEPGIYLVTVTDAEGCEGTATIEVEENTPPSPTFTGETTFCPGDSVLITPEDGYMSYDIDLDNNGLVDVTNNTNESFYVSSVGFSNIIVTDINGCTGSIIIEVDEFTPPSPQATSDTFSFCTDGSVFIGLETDFDVVNWYLDGDLVGNTATIEVDQPGDYQVIVNDMNGCSNETFTTVIESTELTPTITGETAICDNNPITLDAGQGYEVYDWGTFGDSQTIEVTEENTYFVTVTDAGGCSGVDEILVSSSETPMAEVMTSMDICNNSDGDNTSVLDFEGFVSGAQGFWNDDDGLGIDLSNLASVDFDGVLPGFYEFTYTTSIAIDPCEDQEYLLTIEVGECLCPSIAVGELQPICLNDGLINLDSLQISTEPGYWTVEEGNADILNGTLIDPINGGDGNYVFVFNLDIPKENCDSTNTVSLSIIAPPNPGIFDEAQKVCFNVGTQVDLFSLIEGEDVGGVWTETSIDPSSGSAFNDAGEFNTTGQNTGMYTFMYSVTGQSPCGDESVEVEVLVEPAPIADAGEDAMLNCDLLVVEIGTNNSIGDNLSFNWTEIKGEDISNPTNSQINVDQEGTYVMEVSDSNQCIDTDTVEVTRNTDFPDVVTEGNDPFCTDENSGSIVADANGGNGPYQYSIDNGVTWTDANSFLDLESGTYTVLVQDQNECTGEVQIELENPDIFLADIGQSIFSTNITDTLISLDITGGASNLQAAIWTVNDSIVCEGPECLSYNVNAEEDAEVCVIATSINGCVDSTCIVIRSLDIDISYTGNTFTPNEDGLNDVFYIQGANDIEEVNYFRIYNRWGELVFSQEQFPANDISYGWDGTFKGKRLNPGVFVYAYEVVYEGGGVELLFGDVTIVN